VDWSGCRALLFASTDGSLRLQGERLNDITDQFPEVATASAALGGRVAVLDGVIAVLDPEGRPDLAALGHRLVSGPLGAPVAVYLATDLLHLDGAPSISWPLERRLAALASLVMPDARIQLTEPVYGEGDALADAASQRGLQALLARRGSAPYRPGIASPDRLRIDLTPQADCAVVGMASRSPGWGERRLVLAEHDRGRLMISATVGVSLDPSTSAWIDARALDLQVAEAPVGGDAGPDNVQWLRPELVATVRHHGRRGDGVLIEPSLVTIRDDVDVAWCRRRRPVAPPGHGFRPSTFRPTVLVTLPITS